ncbi:STAS domain-containing protein [Sorangium sp. So ce1335]|uniref:STAS domain-containing protein n=1 Tax=Sorangium sp. So ce1335 TaxID=3133335 RepID=UPI003F5EA5A4
MVHTDPPGAPHEAQTIEELRRENESLRRRVAELEVPARRFQALYDGGVVSVQIYRDGYSAEGNPCWDRLWGLRPEDVHGKYSLLEDAQVAAGGFLPLVERAFHDGEAVRLPTIRYDAVALTGYGEVRWVASALLPVNGPAGPREVIQLHMDVGELKHSEEELRAQKQQLEAAVAERTAELAEQLQVREEQQRAIAALSTPVLRVWSGILAVPLIGHIDPDRAARVLEVLLQSIVATSAEHVIIDVTGVPQIDAQAARYLRDTVRAAELLGARCMIVGISGHTARLLVECGLDFEGVPTFGTLQEGLRRLLSRRPGAE